MSNLTGLQAFRNDHGKSALNKITIQPGLIDENLPKRMLERFTNMSVTANRSIRKEQGK
jgi:hypothetical protein